MLKVHLTGNDHANWALDEDLKLIKEVLSNNVEFTNIHQADIVHSVTPRKLAQLPQDWLINKKILCHISTSVPAFFQQPANRYALERAGIIISRSQQAVNDCEKLNINSYLIPYTIDTSTFYSMPADHPDIVEIQNRWLIPSDRYIIGNFHRDTEGADIISPKLVKGPDVFVEIVSALYQMGKPIHVLIAGPRRHYLRKALTERGVPFTFVGKVVEGDDYPSENILPRAMLNLLYNLLDLCLVTSRSEGGPHSILEASITRCKVMSTRVGHASDVLQAECLVDTPVDFISAIAKDIDEDWLTSTLDQHEQKVHQNHTSGAIKPKLHAVYEQLDTIDSFSRPSLRPNQNQHPPPPPLWIRAIRKIFPTFRTKSQNLSVSLWHKFFKPPYGGGNQFLLALEYGLKTYHNTKVRHNKLNYGIDAYLLNAVQFDILGFEKYLNTHEKISVLHRIDGPIHTIRGTADRSLDEETYRLNQQYAGATVIQSIWNLQQIINFPYQPTLPTVIHNAVDPTVFNSQARIPFDRNRKIRIIATSWSDNPRKGGPVYKWLEENLDWNRFEFTFVGNLSEDLKIAKHLPAMNSHQLADILRQHDIYITASRNDPCSNALIEAQSCGLPALYYNDGGHPELVRFGGLPFNDNEGILVQLEKLVTYYEIYQNMISVPHIEKVSKTYLELFQNLANGL